jgi:hypothetical protein
MICSDNMSEKERPSMPGFNPSTREIQKHLRAQKIVGKPSTGLTDGPSRQVTGSNVFKMS